MWWIAGLLACASDDPAWAVNHMSVVPTADGIEGTQTWEFYTERWGRAKDDDAYVCARAQTFTGEVVATPSDCDGCRFAYTIYLDELGGDCNSIVAVDPAYELPYSIAVGDLPDDFVDMDPHSGRSLGWYASFDNETWVAHGFAWDDALDWGGDPGPPGWNDGQAYTLWPAYAWDLAGSGA